MKKLRCWAATFTQDMTVFKTEPIEGTSYTDAYVNLMVKYPDAIICELKEIRDEHTRL